ncbi:MAG: TRAP transporter large permease [Deltaproteobacteria bacterium]|nr:TRAP transporter large permease [Deltaproteobacteria bacterium]MBL7204580.1 TRAP transporter large permease [Desulfobacteraceae bacterium]
MMDPGLAVGISIFLVLFLLSFGLPVYASLGITGILGCLAIKGPHLAFAQLKTFPYANTASYLLVVIPLFIIMGHFAFKAGLSRDTYNIGKTWLSRFPAGIGMATVIGCAGFAACTGSSVATAATMGAIAIPEMLKLGYDRKIACGIVAAAGTLGILIPPSVILVFYGSITDTSVGALLVAGFIPGIISILIYLLGLLFLGWIYPSLTPDARSVPWRERLNALKGGWGLGLLFFIVIGGLYIGFFTPTEAAATGAFFALIMVFIRRKQAGKLSIALSTSFVNTLRTTCMVFLVLMGAGLYSFFLTLAQVPQVLSAWVAALAIPPVGVVGLFLILLIPLGMFLDSFSVLVISLPIIFPVVVNQLGYDAIWFGILCTKMCEFGLITPPVGLNVYVLASVRPDVPLTDIFRGCLWFLLFDLVTITVLWLFPVLTTWLPGTMYTWK